MTAARCRCRCRCHNTVTPREQAQSISRCVTCRHQPGERCQRMLRQAATRARPVGVEPTRVIEKMLTRLALARRKFNPHAKVDK